MSVSRSYSVIVLATLAVLLWACGRSNEDELAEAEQHFERALSLKDQGLVQDTIAAYNDTILVNPEHAGAYYQRESPTASLSSTNRRSRTMERRSDLTPATPRPLRLGPPPTPSNLPCARRSRTTTRRSGSTRTMAACTPNGARCTHY